MPLPVTKFKGKLISLRYMLTRSLVYRFVSSNQDRVGTLQNMVSKLHNILAIVIILDHLVQFHCIDRAK